MVAIALIVMGFVLSAVGAILDRISLYRAYRVAQNWPPKRSPEMTPAAYNVVYFDGTNQVTHVTPAEIGRWATESNKAQEGKPNRIVRIVDQQGALFGESRRLRPRSLRLVYWPERGERRRGPLRYPS
jgi:hypothetical protein